MESSPTPADGCGETHVLVIDDHPLISTALTVALRAEGIEVTRVPVNTVEEILARADRPPPGLVLLDLDLGERLPGPRPTGLRLIRPLRERGWTILIVTASQDRRWLAAAVVEGAAGWVSKTESFRRLVATALDALAGREVLRADTREQLLVLHRHSRAGADVLAGKIHRLTPRERQVLDLLSGGHSPQAIAGELTSSLATIRAHIRAILAKLEVQSQLAAVAVLHEARRAGVV